MTRQLSSLIACALLLAAAVGCSGFKEERVRLEKTETRLERLEGIVKEQLIPLTAQLVAEAEQGAKDADAQADAIREIRRRLRELIKDILRDLPPLPERDD